MRCRQVKRKKWSYIHRELPREVQMRIAQHLSCCPDCAAEIDADKKTAQALSESIPCDRCPDVMPDVIRSIQEHNPAPLISAVAEWFYGVRITFAGAATAALVAGFAAGFVLSPQLPSSVPTLYGDDGDALHLELFQILPSTPDGAYIQYIYEQGETG